MTQYRPHLYQASAISEEEKFKVSNFRQSQGPGPYQWTEQSSLVLWSKLSQLQNQEWVPASSLLYNILNPNLWEKYFISIIKGTWECRYL